MLAAHHVHPRQRLGVTPSMALHPGSSADAVGLWAVGSGSRFCEGFCWHQFGGRAADGRASGCQGFLKGAAPASTRWPDGRRSAAAASRGKMGMAGYSRSTSFTACPVYCSASRLLCCGESPPAGFSVCIKALWCASE